MHEGRTFKECRELILTALLIYRQGYLNVQEIQNVMDLFKKFTMKRPTDDGQIQEPDKVIEIMEHGVLERLIKSMIGINKVISPAFVRDWCLKCCRYLSATSDIFT